MPRQEVNERARRPRHRRSSATACLLAALIIAGTIGSALGARSWRDAVRTENQRAFQATATGVADTLTMSLQRDADVVALAQTLVVTDPTIDNANFTQWFASLDSAKRFPGSIGFAYVQLVDTAALPTFVGAASADPPLGLSFPFPFAISPAGTQPPYCLMRLIAVQITPGTPLEVSSNPNAISLFSNFLDPWSNECAGPEAPEMQTAVSSGKMTISSFSKVLTGLAGNNPSDKATVRQVFGDLPPIELLLPVESVATPQSPSHQLGWVGGIFDANALLDPILHVQKGMAFVLSARGPGGMQVLSRVGRIDSGGPVETFHLTAQGGWTLQLSGPAGSGSSPTAQSEVVFGGGLLVTLLLFFLIWVLTRSRSFALRLVDEKTTELRHQAGHDTLTDLPNRALILDEANRAIARGLAEGATVALLFIDLDGFKDVNDAHGHGVGDALLRSVADRFSAMLGEADLMGRLGGDEFIVLAEGPSAVAPEELASRLLATCEAPFHVDDLPSVSFTVSASIGIATEEHETAEGLLRDADIALHQAKTAGRNQFVVFCPEMRVAVWRRVDLRNELNAAIASNQFFLVYQPLFELATMRVTGAEALLRWQHPTRGLVMPLEFIPALEESGLILDVGRFVLYEACRQTKRWHDLGLPICMSINVSGRQLESDRLVPDVLGALADAQLDPHAIVVEITETALMHDAASATLRMARLKEVGVRIAIDDFGTGYSSLSYLHQFPADSLKIDRTFVEAMDEGAEGVALVHATVQLGRALGLETLAEGIEKQSQLDLLRAEGCETGQGYLFARPMTARNVEQFLLNRTVVGRAGDGEVEVVRQVPVRG